MKLRVWCIRNGEFVWGWLVSWYLVKFDGRIKKLGLIFFVKLSQIEFFISKNFGEYPGFDIWII